jgi:hypothetical protein
MGLLLLSAITVAAVTYWHRFFVGTDAKVLTMTAELQYYITMTVLVAALAIGLLSLYHLGGDDP